MVLALISFGLSSAMLGLCAVSLVYTSRNVTKIDLLKGTFKLKDTQNLSPNPYDLGVVSNFGDVFEGSAWTWWLPTTMIGKADALRFPMVPPVKRK
jgi:hypothetical protein